MKKALLILIALFVIGGGEIVRAQSNSSSETLSIGVNQAKKVFSRKITIRLLTVVEDSRCPEGTECVQAGNAKLRFSVARGTDAPHTIELDTNGAGSATVEGFVIKLDSLAPTPKTAAPIKPKDYVANLTVTQGAG